MTKKTKPRKRDPKEASKMGRPKIEIDWTEFDKLCAIQCTEEEIAAWFKCTVDTLNARCKGKYKQTFSEVYAQKRQAGHTSIRRNQFKRMQDGSDTMLIWLGKQYLGQQDKQGHDITGHLEIHFDREDADL
ncbi:MAG: hypothetical protein KJ556_21310 [Gammaproteobacteria bacterium]|nr:hypothetical protein [Gammaproteobacteria bacterium]